MFDCEFNYGTPNGLTICSRIQIAENAVNVAENAVRVWMANNYPLHSLSLIGKPTYHASAYDLRTVIIDADGTVINRRMIAGV